MPVRRGSQEAGQPAKPEHKLHKKVAQEIGAGILRGDYPPGALLPNEAEWSRKFGVSRTAVREAIKTLSGKGLLVSQPKVGSRVEPRARWSLLDRDVLDWHSAATGQRAFLESTQEIRQLIETGIAALAARKRTPEQLAELEEALEAMRVAPDTDSLVEADVRYHLALLAAANNDLLAPFGLIVERALAILFAYTSRNNPRPEIIIPLHEAIVDAVRAGDSGAARDAVVALLADTDGVIAKGHD